VGRPPLRSLKLGVFRLGLLEDRDLRISVFPHREKVLTQLRGVWIAEDVGKVAPPNYKIDEATRAVPFANEGSFSLSKPSDGFPPGKYRLEIYIGNDLMKTVPFTVKTK